MPCRGASECTGMGGIADVKFTGAGEGGAVAGIAGGQHAVEHVDPYLDALQQVEGVPTPMRLTRFPGR